jgi:hypothetical protein
MTKKDIFTDVKISYRVFYCPNLPSQTERQTDVRNGTKKSRVLVARLKSGIVEGYIMMNSSQETEYNIITRRRKKETRAFLLGENLAASNFLLLVFRLRFGLRARQGLLACQVYIVQQ